MKYPIYIPSLGRYQNMRTVKMLLTAGINNFYVIVEKNEKVMYERSMHNINIIAMPSSNYGTSTDARNFCLDHASKRGIKKIWMLDDDITRVFKHDKGVANKFITLDELFTEIEDFAKHDKSLHAVGMRTSASFLKQVINPLQYNTSLSSVYLLKTEPFRFRGTMLVDMDYQLQILRAGYRTLRMENYAFAFITPTKIHGGYYDIYTDDDKRRYAINQFLKYNPDVDPTIVRNTTGFLVLKNISKIWRKFK